MRRTTWIAALAALTAAGACELSPRAVPGDTGGGGAGGSGASTSSSSTTTSSSTGTGGTPPVPPCDAPVTELCNPFGVDLEAAALSGDAYWAFITKTLEVPFYRPPPIVLDTGAACDRCAGAAAQGLRLVLAVRASGTPGTPASPPADLAAFRQQLGALLDTYAGKVEAVVVEDGADTPAVWAGSADGYLAEVAAACEVAHAKGVKCTDGGLATTTMVLLLAEYDLSMGNGQSAVSVVTEAGDNPEVQAAFATWPPATAADVSAALAGQKARFDAAHALLAGVRAAGVDYASFHWHERGQDALDLAIAFTRTRTGCNSVATPDLGQRTQDAFELMHKAGDAAELGLRLVVWTARDDGGAVVDASGALTTNGAALAGLTTTVTCDD
jgi:hypothetical protein